MIVTLEMEIITIIAYPDLDTQSKTIWLFPQFVKSSQNNISK